jgi:hypothetical protein
MNVSTQFSSIAVSHNATFPTKRVGEKTNYSGHFFDNRKAGLPTKRRLSMSRKHIAFCLAAQPFILLLIALFFISPVLAHNFEVNVESNRGDQLSGLKVYAFSESGAYTGKNAATDGSGIALFDSADFADGTYKFRVDYLGMRFWSRVITLPDASAVGVVIDEETVEVTVSTSSGPAADVRAYLFSEGGSYLGQYETTDAEGVVSFDLPVGKPSSSGPISWGADIGVTSPLFRAGVSTAHLLRQGAAFLA